MNFSGSKVSVNFEAKKIINDTSIKLMFGDTPNYLSLFKNIHEYFNDADFIEIKDVDIKDFADAFLSENNISFNDIKNDKSLLKKFVKDAKRETDITLTDLASFLGLSRNIVGYQYRKP